MDWLRFSNPSDGELLRTFLVGWNSGDWQRNEKTIRVLKERFPFNGIAYRTGKYSQFGPPGGPYSFSKSVEGLKQFMSGIAIAGGPSLLVYQGQIINGIDIEKAAHWYLVAMQRREVPKIGQHHLKHIIRFQEVLSTEKITLKRKGTYRKKKGRKWTSMTPRSS